jgi:hypothetical protein
MDKTVTGAATGNSERTRIICSLSTGKLSECRTCPLAATEASGMHKTINMTNPAKQLTLFGSNAFM